MGALLDELACLTRDLMVLKTAPREGIAMLSGVATDKEVQQLATRFSGGELVRMMNLIQQTMAGFTRNASRRMDAELCLVNLCQPELSLDAQALNARLTKIEDQIATGAFAVAEKPVQKPQPQEDDDRPPMPGDDDAPPDPNEMPVMEAPAPVDRGFWMDVASAVQREVPRPVMGLFSLSENAPVQGILRGNELLLLCANQFVMESVSKPNILTVVQTKASAKLGRPVSVKVVDRSAKVNNTPKMAQLLDFGRANKNIINIKE
jgi:DNA polymerase-3 subunit gamma/tau